MCRLGEDPHALSSIIFIALKVSFANESGWDTGGPSKEYWRLLVREIVDGYTAGGLFVKSIPALVVSAFQQRDNVLI